MGYNITLLAIYVNIYSSPQFAPFFWLKGLIVALPAILVISNVMLGNNICDRDKDIQIGKHTLVYYIGRSDEGFNRLLRSKLYYDHRCGSPSLLTCADPAKSCYHPHRLPTN